MELDWKREETKLELLASYHFMREGKAVRDRASQFGRVVKAWDLKSHGVTRAGSNPAADASFAPAQFLLQSRFPITDFPKFRLNQKI